MHVSPFGWVLPALLVCYGIAASALLQPSITQEMALRYGKILHLLIAVPLIAVLVLPWYHHQRRAFDLTWLVYAVLWFRIRETTPQMPPNKALHANRRPAF
jgi:hypothetical protein